jgi:hypothetical protein
MWIWGTGIPEVLCKGDAETDDERYGSNDFMFWTINYGEVSNLSDVEPKGAESGNRVQPAQQPQTAAGSNNNHSSGTQGTGVASSANNNSPEEHPSDPGYPGIDIYRIPWITSALTLPPFGIIAPKNVTQLLLDHEYGHYLQYKYFGAEIYYNDIATAGVHAFHTRTSYNQYQHVWTEMDANTFSYNFFMANGGKHDICLPRSRTDKPIYNPIEFLFINSSIFNNHK